MFAKSLPVLPIAFVSWLASLLPPPRVRLSGVDELKGMSDRELADLGIGRSEIPHVMEADRHARVGGHPGLHMESTGSPPPRG
jgi:hypothetical protein